MSSGLYGIARQRRCCEKHAFGDGYPQRDLKYMENANWQVLLLMFILSGVVLWKITAARRGKELYIRQIPGLNAIDEAVGRAAELGAPLLFNPGLAAFNDIQTLAALGILRHVCKVAAKYGTRIIVTTTQPVLVPICEEVLKGAFGEAGRPEMANSSEVRFVSDRSDLAALANSQILIDEKVASHFIFGGYDFTALLNSEGGQIAGCMQIAGTADFYQVAFFIPTCDYVIIVEELYACSAYLTRQPTIMGSVVGQDYGKLFLFLLIILGVVGATIFGQNNPLNVYEQVMRF
jgi:hypothetical protein